MRVLALEPFYGGSHKAFLDDWSSNSSHDWTIIGLPPHKWKWRMRHAAVTFAEDVSSRMKNGEQWDLIFCSDMLNLAEFKGLVNDEIAQLPSISYFHENQLTYPVRLEDERDLHFVMNNLVTALASDQVWFNSAYHRDTFLKALPDFLKRMPDYHSLDSVEQIRDISFVFPQGIRPMPSRKKTGENKPHILWVARWEHDKNPELFFKAIYRLIERDIDFQLSVIGESFSDVPEVFHSANERLSKRICNWGYQKTRDEYEAVLLAADIVISTADHEFFGVSIVESIAAGAYPLLPKRLSYPEILRSGELIETERFFYDNSLDDLTDKLEQLVKKTLANELWGEDESVAKRLVEPFYWERLAPQLDKALETTLDTKRT